MSNIREMQQEHDVRKAKMIKAYDAASFADMQRSIFAQSLLVSAQAQHAVVAALNDAIENATAHMRFAERLLARWDDATLSARGWDDATLSARGWDVSALHDEINEYNK